MAMSLWTTVVVVLIVGAVVAVPGPAPKLSVTFDDSAESSSYTIATNGGLVSAQCGGISNQQPTTNGKSAVLTGSGIRDIVFSTVDCASTECFLSFWYRAGTGSKEELLKAADGCYGATEGLYDDHGQYLSVSYQTSSGGQFVELQRIPISRYADNWANFARALPSTSATTVLKITSYTSYGGIYDVWAVDNVFITRGMADSCDYYDPNVYDTQLLPSLLAEYVTFDIDDAENLVITVNSLTKLVGSAFAASFVQYTGNNAMFTQNCYSSGINYAIKSQDGGGVFIPTDNYTHNPFLNPSWSVQYTGACSYTAKLVAPMSSFSSCVGPSGANPVKYITSPTEKRVQGNLYIYYVLPPTPETNGEYIFKSSYASFDVGFTLDPGQTALRVRVIRQQEKIVDNVFSEQLIFAWNTTSALTPSLKGPRQSANTGKDTLMLRSFTANNQQVTALFESFPNETKSVFNATSTITADFCTNLACTIISPFLYSFSYAVSSNTVAGYVRYSGRLWASNTPTWTFSQIKAVAFTPTQPIYLLVVSEAPNWYTITVNRIRVISLLTNQETVIYDATQTTNQASKMLPSEYTLPTADPNANDKIGISPSVAFKYTPDNANVRDQVIIRADATIVPSPQSKRSVQNSLDVVPDYSIGYAVGFDVPGSDDDKSSPASIVVYNFVVLIVVVIALLF